MRKFALSLFVITMSCTSAVALPPDRKLVYLMSDLVVVHPRLFGWNSKPEWHTFYEHSKEAVSKWGARGIYVDEWFTFFEKGKGALFEDGGRPEYYDQVHQIIHDAGGKISAGLMYHAAGVNFADNVVIPIAHGLRKRIDATADHPDLAYTSETGARNDSLVSVWGTEYVIDYLKSDFYRKWRDRYASKASWFDELVIGTGSAGEARLPSRDQHDQDAGFKKEADHPGRGLLQISSQLAQTRLREAMQKKYGTIEALNAAWKLRKPVALPHGAPFERFAFASWNEFGALTTKKEVDAFFARHGEYSQMGQDIFTWQRDSVLASLEMHIEAAIQVFHVETPDFADKKIIVRLSGDHWGFFRRLPQLTGGMVSTHGADTSETTPILERQPKEWTEELGHGYRPLFEMLARIKKKHPKSHVIPYMTCAEKPNCSDKCLHEGAIDPSCHCMKAGGPSFSRAESLALAFSNLAREFEQEIGFENADARGLKDDEQVRRVEKRMKENPWVSRFTALRLVDAKHSIVAQQMIRRVADFSHTAAGSCGEAIAAAASLDVAGIP